MAAGRPPKYIGNVAKHIVRLVRQNNASRAMEILNAPTNSELAKSRNLNLVPKPLGISLPTVFKLAKNAGVELTMGRPKAA